MRTFPIMADHERVDFGKGKQFPAFYIPWDVIAPHEAQAKENHDQTLQRLSERGGLSPEEAVCVLEDRPLRDSKMTREDAYYHLSVLLSNAMLKERSK